MAMQKLIVAVCVVFLAAASAQAQQNNKPAVQQPKTAAAGSKPQDFLVLEDVLNKNGYKLAAEIFNIAQVTKPASNPKAAYTLFIPTDEAILAFLKDMGLTMEDLKQRPMLAKALVGQHMLLGSNVRTNEIFQKGNKRVVTPQAGRSSELLVVKETTKDGKEVVKVTDVQGSTATVKSADIKIDDLKTGHAVDMVLMGDAYYKDFEALCRDRRLTLSDFCYAVKYANLSSVVEAPDFANTVFIPNNAAFTKVGLGGSNPPTPAQVADILKFHVVKGVYEVPRGFKAGQPYPTLLPGQDLKVAYEKVVVPNSSPKKAFTRVFAVAGDGKRAKVLKANVHVAKSLVNGIDAILLPNMGAKANGRKLLQFGWGMSAGPTAEMDAAASAINNAVDGQQSVASAADESLLGAEELSVPGDYDQVENGINPW